MKSEEKKKREEARKILKKRGIEKKCLCSNIEECEHIKGDKKHCTITEMRDAMKNVSIELSLENELTFNELNESSDSEMDFKYTPQNVMKRSKLCRRPPVCNVGTQYVAQKIEEVIIEEKKLEVKKLQQALKGNSKTTKSSPKGVKIVAKSAAAKKEEKKKEIKDAKKNVGASEK
jgi:arsenate reductase-like glutaredoxin family protein